MSPKVKDEDISAADFGTVKDETFFDVFDEVVMRSRHLRPQRAHEGSGRCFRVALQSSSVAAAEEKGLSQIIAGDLPHDVDYQLRRAISVVRRGPLSTCCHLIPSAPPSHCHTRALAKTSSMNI